MPISLSGVQEMFFLHMTLWYLVLSPMYLEVSNQPCATLRYYYLPGGTLSTLRYLVVFSTTPSFKAC